MGLIERIKAPALERLVEAFSRPPLTKSQIELLDKHERLVRSIFDCSEQYSIEDLRTKSVDSLVEIWDDINHKHNNSRNFDYDLHVKLSELG